MSRTVFLGILLILALLIGATPIAMGVMARHMFETWIRTESGHSVEAQIINFDQGYARSTARTRWVLQSESRPELTLIFSHDIRHVPNLRRELFWISTQLDSAPGHDEWLRHYFGSVTALSAMTTVGVNQEIDTTFRIPPVRTVLHEDSSTLLEWQGVTGRLTSSPDAATDVYEQTISTAGLHVAGRRSLLLNDLHATFRFPRFGKKPELPFVQARIKEIAAFSESMTARIAGTEIVSGYDRDDSRINARIRIGANELKAQSANGTVILQRPYTELKIDNLHEATIELLRRLSAGATPDKFTSNKNRQRLDSLGALLDGLANHSTRATISAGASSESRGTIKGEAEFTVRQRVADESTGPRSDFDSVQGMFRASASRTLLENFLASRARDDAAIFLNCKGMRANEADIEMMTSSMAKGALRAQEKAGTLARVEDEYRMEIVLSHGHVTVNGQPFQNVLFSLPFDGRAHFAPGSGFSRIAKFGFSNAHGQLAVILEGTACVERINRSLQVTIVDGKARLNPKVSPLKAKDVFELRATLGRWAGEPQHSRWAIGQRSNPVKVRRTLLTPQDEIELDGLIFEIPVPGSGRLDEQWIIFEGYDGHRGYWYSQGPGDLFSE